MERRLSGVVIEELVRAYRDGSSTAELADRYGISKNAVRYQLSKRGMQRRYQSLTESEVDHVERLYLAGHSLVTCGKLSGFAASSIKDALHRRGTMRLAGGRSALR
ncbi:hypothetical protein NRB56_28840 [Nocardia sp. RB56]|uniref:Uncharacterized protein n=1 Tax=Nocardia aurantia TaxID=2585199 RepID=A0A7K0DNN0_9NOCA|nr:hypothetical protein [Nocardia aurantia]